MGFYIRKSVSVGPFRFNLSNSGLGLSAGIKGFRVGTGPRGNYVHMGRNGIYFRQTLPPPSRRSDRNQIPDESASGVVFQEIESGSVSQMVDSSSEQLLQEINSKAQKPLIWPWIFGLSICVVGVLAALNIPSWVYFVLIPLCSGGVLLAVHYDKLRKTIVLFYNLEPHMEAPYQGLHNAFTNLVTCSRTWHIESEGKILTTYDWKVNAGASALVKRKVNNPRIGDPSYFKSNISIPILPAGRQTLYLLPDRILVWDTAGVGAVNFKELNVIFNQQRFIESEGVPSDARVVDKTWRYVNKSGGPDRRFNNNRELPIALYEGILLTSKSGLQELFQTSKTGIGTQFEMAVKNMASAIARCGEAKTSEGLIKCPCSNCNINIEFPSDGIGQTVTCPRCGMEMVLYEPSD